MQVHIQAGMNSGRFEEMRARSLRLSDVSPIKRKAIKHKLRVITADLGDPCVFGFKPPARVLHYLHKVIETPLMYTQSIGYEPLIEELSYGGVYLETTGNAEQVKTRYKLNIGENAIIYTSPGSSGVVRAYLSIIGGGKKEQLVVFVPDWIYPLFLAEAANVEAVIVPVPLKQKSGCVDSCALEKIVTETIKNYGNGPRIRYAITLTTIGNPLGSAMTANIFDDITEIMRMAKTKFSVTIHRITDPTYEPFRRDKKSGFDPIERILTKGSHGIELVTGTFSKRDCLPGCRVGYGVVLAPDSKEFLVKIASDIDAYMAITLGTVNVQSQMALALWLKDIRTSAAAYKEEQERINELRKQVHERVLYFASSIVGMENVELHPLYFTDGSSLDPNKLNSFYVLWRFIMEKKDLSQAAIFAQKTFDKAQNEINCSGTQITPVVFMNDADMFLETTVRDNTQQFIRAVALTDRETTDKILELIGNFKR